MYRRYKTFLQMKKIAVLLSAAMMLNSCVISFNRATVVRSYSENGGDYTEEITDLPRFHEIEAYGPFNVHFVQSDGRKVLLEGTEESVNAVITDVTDDKLVLRLENGTYNKLVLKVTVYAPSITDFLSSGSGNLYDCDGHDEGGNDVEYICNGSGDLSVMNLKCGDLEGRSNGSGNMNLQSVSCDDVDISSNGSGDVTLSDITARGGIDFSSSGSGNMRAGRITNADSDADLSLITRGSGDANLDEVNIKGDIDLRTSGSGSITVNGSCNDVSASTHGSGSIRGSLKYSSLRQSRHGSGNIRL